MSLEPDDVKTITRADLAEAVYAQVGLSRNESSDLVEQILDEMMDALASGDNVKISSFGSFTIREKGERIGRNPKTGVEVPIKPRKVLTFKASHVLKDKINKATEAMLAAKSETPTDGNFNT
ncbi:MAG: integration host factor subunit alpha [Pseudomonadota bacterium]